MGARVLRGRRVLAAVAFAFLPDPRPFDAVLFVALASCYALASRLEFEVGPGAAVPTELLFVPMLLLLPASLVPVAVVAGLAGAGALDLVRRRASWQTFCANVASAGFSLAAAGAALALGEPGVGVGSWVLLPVLLLAQFAGDFAVAGICEWAALAVTPRQLASPLRRVFAVDALLAPLGLAVASAAATTSEAAVFLPLPALIILDRLARERRVAVDRSLELSRAYRGTALLLGDVVEADDAYTGSHSRGVVELALAVADRLGLSAADQRRPSSRRSCTTSARSACPTRSSTSRGRSTAAERAVIEHAHHRWASACSTQVGGLLARGRRDRPLVPRALGRQRLPGRPRRRGDPARRPDRLRLPTRSTR